MRDVGTGFTTRWFRKRHDIRLRKSVDEVRVAPLVDFDMLDTLIPDNSEIEHLIEGLREQAEV